MTPHATVIVCTRDRPRELARCLRSLAALEYAALDILVVDNGSTEGIAEVCRARGAACIREPMAGLTRARNLGARAARGEIVAYIDDDAIAEPGWLSAIAAEFTDPLVAAVAGRTRYMIAPDDALEISDAAAPGDAVRARMVVDLATRDWFTRACFGGIGDGNTMAFRRRVLTDAMPFDERIGRGRLIDGGDEHIAFMSVIADGYRAVHAPAAVVRHPAPATVAGRRAKRLRDLQSSVSYFLFVTTQFPGHRAELARFLGRAVIKRLRHRTTDGVWPRLSLRDTWESAARGVLQYWRARGEWLSVPVRGTGTRRVATLR
ncbi:MAG TPA: glycosyltransferase family 2 protein [Vicinamibacterales bacterium]|nr:glycosyltransferase family 2 protein [Vicinamibacterales bacterium]